MNNFMDFQHLLFPLREPPGGTHMHTKELPNPVATDLHGHLGVKEETWPFYTAMLWQERVIPAWEG